MAQFYAEIQGNRGKASRMGSKASGLWAHIRGWDIGVRVQIENVHGVDVANVWLSEGSNRSGTTFLGAFVVGKNGKPRRLKKCASLPHPYSDQRGDKT